MISQRAAAGVIHKSFQLASKMFISLGFLLIGEGERRRFRYLLGLRLKLWESEPRIRKLNLVLLIFTFH